MAYSSEPQTGHLNSKPFSFSQDVSNSGENSAKLAPPCIGGRLALSSNIEELALRRPVASIHEHPGESVRKRLMAASVARLSESKGTEMRLLRPILSTRSTLGYRLVAP